MSKGVRYTYDIYKDDPCHGCAYAVEATAAEQAEQRTARPYRCKNFGRAVKLAERVLALVKAERPAQVEISQLEYIYNPEGRYPCKWTNTLRPDCYCEKGGQEK